MELLIKKSHIRNRNGVAYIDCNTNYGRLRFSAGEEYRQENLADIASRIKNLCINFLQGQSASKRAESSKADDLSTLKNLAQSFFKNRCAHLKDQTLNTYKSHLKFLCEKVSYPLELLDQNAYNLVVKDESKKCVEFFNRLVSYGKEAGVIKERVITLKMRASFSATSIKPLKLDEVEQVLRVCENKAKESQIWLEARNYLAFAIFSGARVGEILALEIDDVDLENNKVYINKSKQRMKNKIDTTKTGKARYIDLLKNARIALESQIEIKKRAKQTRLFSMREKDIAKMWKEALQECGLESRVLYQTRHSFATIMLTNGEEPLWISAMLGHSSLHTTFTHYVKYIPQKKERASFVGFVINEGVSDEKSS